MGGWRKCFLLGIFLTFRTPTRTNFLSSPFADANADRLLGKEKSSELLFRSVNKIRELETAAELSAALSPDSFDDPELPNSVLNSQPRKPTAKVVLFYSVLCSHCHRFAPTYREIAATFNCEATLKGTSSHADSGDGRLPHTDGNKQDTISGAFCSGVEFLAFECSGASDRREGCMNNSNVHGFPSMIVHFVHPKIPTHVDARKSEGSDTDRKVIFQSIPLRQRDSDFIIKTLHDVLPSRGCVACLSGGMSDTSSLSGQKLLSESAAPVGAPSAREGAVDDKIGGGPANGEVSEGGVAKKGAALHDSLLGIHYLLSSWRSTFRSQTEGYIELMLFLLLASLVLPGDNIRQDIRIVVDWLNREAVHLLFEEQKGVRQSETVAVFGLINISNDTLSISIDDLLESHTFGGVSASSPPVTCPSTDCCIWSLFHVLSVGLRTRRSNTLDIPPMTDKTVLYRMLRGLLPSPYDAMEIFRDVVEVALPCERCRSHFLESYNTCDFQRCQWVRDQEGIYDRPEHGPHFRGVVEEDVSDAGMGLVMWLWRVHTAVKVQACVVKASDESVRNHKPSEPSPERGSLQASALEGQDVRYPAVADCPQCRVVGKPQFVITAELIELAKKGALHNKDVDHVSDFNLRKTFDFLMSQFWDSSWTNGSLKSVNWTEEAHGFALGFDKAVVPPFAPQQAQIEFRPVDSTPPTSLIVMCLVTSCVALFIFARACRFCPHTWLSLNRTERK